MQHFFEEKRLMAHLGSDSLYFLKAFFFQEKWRWLPAGLVAVAINAAEAFNELFWIVVTLWFSDLCIGILRAWHDSERELEWVRIFRSVVKLFVITVAVIAMNGIEQMLGQLDLDTGGKLVVATLLVIGSADAISILANLSYFYPGMLTVADKVKAMLGQAADHDRRTEDRDG